MEIRVNCVVCHQKFNFVDMDPEGGFVLLDRVTVEPCGHEYHHHCLVQYLRDHSQCYQCGRQIDEKTVQWARSLSNSQTRVQAAVLCVFLFLFSFYAIPTLCRV